MLDDLRSAKLLIVDDEPANVRLLDHHEVMLRILVDDDEADVAGLLAELLRMGGHAVDGAEALDKIGRRRYHPIPSDTPMPVLDGIASSRDVERCPPELQGRVAFMTGDTLGAQKREFLKRIGAPSLVKPFSLDEVQRVVQRLLER